MRWQGAARDQTAIKPRSKQRPAWNTGHPEANLTPMAQPNFQIADHSARMRLTVAREWPDR
jgi:hypothetical protein